MVKLEQRQIKITVYKRKHYLRVGEVAKLLGVHPDTVRRWDKHKWLEPVRTPGGTRLYEFNMIRKIINDR